MNRETVRKAEKEVVMNVSGVGPMTMPPVVNGGERTVNEGGGATQTTPAVVNGGGSVASDADFEKIMEEPIKQANKSLAPYGRQIEREIHEVTKALMYTIRDTKTNEVIAEYPPRKIQDMIAKMWEMAGLMLDQKA
jgi:uncharacterized FlaG/YvyC family protein